MTLTKNKMIREIGRRTRLKNRDVQLMLETLIEVWTEELVSGGRVELENFMVLESKAIIHKNNPRPLISMRRITLRVSKHVRHKLNTM